MATSKNLFLLVALLFSLALLLCSHAAASEKSANAVEEHEVDSGRCRHGCCRWHNHRCVSCCRSANEVPVAEAEVAHGGCHYGCCYWYNHRCMRCCRRGHGASDAEVKN